MDTFAVSIGKGLTHAVNYVFHYSGPGEYARAV